MLDMLAGALLFPLFFYFAYRFRLSTVLIGALLTSIAFVCFQLYSLYNLVGLLPFLSLLSGIIVVHMEKHNINNGLKTFPLVYKVIGSFTITTSILAMSFDFFAPAFVKAHHYGTGPLWVFYIITAILGSYVINIKYNDLATIIKENFTWLVLDIWVFILLLVPLNKNILQTTMNISFLIWAILNIRQGYYKKDKFHFYLGILSLLLFLVSKTPVLF